MSFSKEVSGIEKFSHSVKLDINFGKSIAFITVFSRIINKKTLFRDGNRIFV
jgi:hypothetical protein